MKNNGIFLAVCLCLLATAVSPMQTNKNDAQEQTDCWSWLEKYLRTFGLTQEEKERYSNEIRPMLVTLQNEQPRTLAVLVAICNEQDDGISASIILPAMRELKKIGLMNQDGTIDPIVMRLVKKLVIKVKQTKPKNKPSRFSWRVDETGDVPVYEITPIDND